MKEFDFTVRLRFDERITKISQLTEIAQNISSALLFHVNNVDQLCPSANACVEEIKVWNQLSLTIEKNLNHSKEIQKVYTDQEARQIHKLICYELTANENQTLEEPIRYANKNIGGWWETKISWIAYRCIDGNIRTEEFSNIDEAINFAHGKPAKNKDGETIQ